MPIRKRVTDPYSQEYKDFNRYMVQGKPPTAPRKPTSEERKPFFDAIHSMPVGRTVSHEVFYKQYTLPFLKCTYILWGVELAIYPVAIRQSDGSHRFTGCQVAMVRPSRCGKFPLKRLNGDKDAWYGEVIRWIQDTIYGG
jgi:hypothetical protein